MAQELMRHSDRRLTDRLSRYQFAAVAGDMRSIDGFAPLIQILTHISGKPVIWGRGLAKRVRRLKSQEALNMRALDALRNLTSFANGGIDGTEPATSGVTGRLLTN